MTLRCWTEQIDSDIVHAHHVPPLRCWTEQIDSDIVHAHHVPLSDIHVKSDSEIPSNFILNQNFSMLLVTLLSHLEREEEVKCVGE